MPIDERRYSSLLIRTKMSPPRLSRKVVRREGAMQALATGASRALTMVCAPAGFGKTTLLADWREKLLSEGKCVAWLTLDPEDNDESHFVEYLSNTLTEAIGAAVGGAQDHRSGGEIFSAKVIMAGLINTLDQIDQEITLILDDYEAIDEPAVHELLSFLLKHVPPNLHLVVATRAEPPLPLSYLRAHDQLVEIDVEGMRFAIEDTRAFFAGIPSMRFSVSEIRAIHEATDGWVTGLQIASLALRGPGSPGQLLASFSGKQRAVTDRYLLDNVLPQVPPQTVDFMLRTAILDRMTDELCDQVAGSEGHHSLEWLVSQNMFLQRLSDEGCWYRYHALFADFLRDRLRQCFGDEIPTLHLRAAEWFSAHGHWAEAVKHALGADRIDLATEWVGRCAMQEVEDSRVNNLLLWVRKLPGDLIRRRPHLRVALAWALLLTMKLDDSQAIVDDIEHQLASGEVLRSEQLEFELLALTFCQRALKDQTASALELGKICFERMAGAEGRAVGSAWAREAVLNSLIYCYRLTGDTEGIQQVQSPLHRPAPDETRNLFTLSYRASVLGSRDLHAGRLAEGARRLAEALRVCERRAGRLSAAATLLAGTLAFIHYEWGEFDMAEELLCGRFDVIDDACYLDAVLAAYVAQVRIYSVRGETEAAFALLERAETLGRRRSWVRLLAACAAERTRLLLGQGEAAQAGRYVGELETLTAELAGQGGAHRETLSYVMTARARLLMSQSRHAQAVLLLRALVAEHEESHDVYHALRARVLLLQAEAGAGERQGALATLAQVLPVCEAWGVLRTLVDEGAPLADLLRSDPAMMGGLSSCYRARLSKGLQIEPEETRRPAPVVAPAVVTPGGEVLSERERDVLELVARGLSNKQIAKTLFITTETVKWHLKNIYGKLGVPRRTLAVHEARRLSLLRDVV